MERWLRRRSRRGLDRVGRKAWRTFLGIARWSWPSPRSTLPLLERLCVTYDRPTTAHLTLAYSATPFDDLPELPDERDLLFEDVIVAHGGEWTTYPLNGEDEIVREGAASGTYYHGTNQQLRPGDTLKPALLSGLRVFDGDYTYYDPSVVYLTNLLHNAERYALKAVRAQGGTPHVYEIRPIGVCYQDPEAESGFGTDQFCATMGEVVREIPLPGNAHIEEGRISGGRPRLHSTRPMWWTTLWRCWKRAGGPAKSMPLRSSGTPPRRQGRSGPRPSWPRGASP